jgi:hypothetical protein
LKETKGIMKMPAAIIASQDYVSSNDKYNCVKLTINDKLIGYFPEEVIARWVAKNYPIDFRSGVNIIIEPWFIEGEF